MGHFTKHLAHYLPLIGILIAGFFGFFLFSYDRAFQSVIVFATAIGYIVWGLVHHHLHNDLHYSIIVEYVSVALLGLILIYSLLFRV